MIQKLEHLLQQLKNSNRGKEAIKIHGSCLLSPPPYSLLPENLSVPQNLSTEYPPTT